MSISETLLKRVNVQTINELPYEQISKLAMDAQTSLRRLVKLVEELRVKAMLGDKRARGMLHMLSDETHSLYSEAVLEADKL